MWDKKHRYKGILYWMIGVVLLCTGCQKKQSLDLDSLAIEDTQDKETDTKTEKEDQSLQSEESKQKTKEIWIYVCGAVNQPGVYTFDSEVHICELVERAGGFRSDASTTYVNQAQLVGEGEQVYIPTQQEVDSGEETLDHQFQNQEVKDDSKKGKININTATREELMTLSGVGEAKADSIISYREQNGNFQSVEDIMQIEGIKEGVFQKIKDSITV